MFACNAQFSMQGGQQCAAPNQLPDAGPGGAPKGASPGLGGGLNAVFCLVFESCGYDWRCFDYQWHQRGTTTWAYSNFNQRHQVGRYVSLLRYFHFFSSLALACRFLILNQIGHLKRWCHFATTTTILQGLAFLCKLEALLFKAQWY